MVIDSNNKIQRSILTNKCFYQATAQIMNDFEKKGYPDSADETAKVIAAYHNIVQKKTPNTFDTDYNEAFKKIDKAIELVAHKVFSDLKSESFDCAYHSFREFDHINAIAGRQKMHKHSAA